MHCMNSYVERLLDRISNGVLAEDRRNAIAELQSVVAETRAAQLAFGAMGEYIFIHIFIYIYMYIFNLFTSIAGFPVLLSVLKEERDDVEMVRKLLDLQLISASFLRFNLYYTL